MRSLSARRIDMLSIDYIFITKEFEGPSLNTRFWRRMFVSDHFLFGQIHTCAWK
jgi:endonuclease/exonuclease/phosphatase family metal-dependent hydrolase